MKPLDQRILDIYEVLPLSEQRLADVLLQRQREIAVFSATELAAAANVSKATAARLFKRLGYDGFEQLRLQSRTDNSWGSPLKTLERFEDAIVEPHLAQHLENDLSNLRRTFNNLDPIVLTAAVDCLDKAKTVYVIGLRNSFALAHYFRFTVKMLKSDVRLVPMGGLSFSEEFIDLEPGDAVVVIAFRRRPLILQPIMTHVGGRGALVILVTDLSASGTADLAHHVIRCHSRGSYLYDSYTAALSILNYIATALALRGDGRARLERIETLHQELDSFTVPKRRSEISS